MEQAFNTFLIALLTAAGAAITASLTAWGMTRRAKGQIAADLAKQDLKRQQQADEERKQALDERRKITDLLDKFQSLYSSERQRREKLEQLIDELRDKIDFQTTAITGMQENIKRCEASVSNLELRNQELTTAQDKHLKRITDLENEKRDQARQIRELNGRIERVEKERDDALGQLEIRNGELVNAKAKIERLEIDLASTREQLSATVERVTALEKKPDTGSLDPAKVPDVPPTEAKHE